MEAEPGSSRSVSAIPYPRHASNAPFATPLVITGAEAEDLPPSATACRSLCPSTAPSPRPGSIPHSYPRGFDSTRDESSVTQELATADSQRLFGFKRTGVEVVPFNDTGKTPVELG